MIRQIFLCLSRWAINVDRYLLICTSSTHVCLVDVLLTRLLLTCSLCIDAFSLGHPPTILSRRVRIPTNSSLTVSSECHVLPWLLLRLEHLCRFWYKKSYISRFLGTSGQNIDDLYKYSDAKDKLEFMERTLRWRHLAPTAPNSLGNPSSPAQFGMSTVKIVGLKTSIIVIHLFACGSIIDWLITYGNCILQS